MNITQLKQGSLNGLRRQTNECLDNAYNKGFEDGKKHTIDELPELANKENEAYNDGYNNALKDINHAIDVLKDMTVEECEEWFEDCNEIGDVVCRLTIQGIIRRTKAYEEKKKADEESIKRGDEVKDLSSGNIGVVMSIGKLIVYITNNGVYTNTLGSLEKTGRHFEIVDELLEQLRGNKNEKD